MSGIEVAGLAIGVVPIFVEILKSYGTAKRRLKTLNRYVEVVSDIQLGFQVAAACFNNDCRLILQAVVAHPGEVTAMVEDPSHKIWQEESDDIEEKLRSLLQEDYELCQSVVVRVRDILRETQKSLTRLDGDINKNGKQTQKESMRRLWSAFNTATKENEYLQQLESLNRWNKTLSRLRKQRCKIKKSRTFSSVCITRKTTPRSYQQIRTASQQLGKSLHESWSCTNASHSGHQAKLSLDVKSGQQDVQLDIVVACQPKLCEETQRYVYQNVS